MHEIDDDLQGLLEELEIGPKVSEQEPSPAPEKSVKPPQEIQVPPVPSPHLPAPVLESPESVDTTPATDLFSAEDLPPGVADLQEFIRKHDHDYEETKTNLRTDRAKADEVVRILLERVGGGSASGQETESLVQAVKCLVDSNGHMVKLLDSKSKLLSATKGTAIIQQNFGGKADTELEAILTQQIEEDEV